jgi:hypothetical protein
MTEVRTVLVLGGDASHLLDARQRSALPVDELRKNLDDFMDSLKEILPATQKPAGGMTLKTLSVAVGIDAKGQVGFLGTGAEVGGNATLTLNFDIG